MSTWNNNGFNQLHCITFIVVGQEHATPLKTVSQERRRARHEAAAAAAAPEPEPDQAHEARVSTAPYITNYQKINT